MSGAWVEDGWSSPVQNSLALSLAGPLGFQRKGERDFQGYPSSTSDWAVSNIITVAPALSTAWYSSNMLQQHVTISSKDPQHVGISIGQRILKASRCFETGVSCWRNPFGATTLQGKYWSKELPKKDWEKAGPNRCTQVQLAGSLAWKLHPHSAREYWMPGVTFYILDSYTCITLLCIAFQCIALHCITKIISDTYNTLHNESHACIAVHLHYSTVITLHHIALQYSTLHYIQTNRHTDIIRHIYIYIQTYMPNHTDIRTDIRTDIYTDICTYRHMYIQTYIQTYMRCILVHIYSFNLINLFIYLIAFGIPPATKLFVCGRTCSGQRKTRSGWYKNWFL